MIIYSSKVPSEETCSIVLTPVTSDIILQLHMRALANS